MENAQVDMSESKPRMRWAIVVLIAALALGGSVAAAYFLFFRLGPEALLIKSFGRAYAAKTMEYSLSLEGEIVGSATGDAAQALPFFAQATPDKPIKSLLRIDGVLDHTDAAHPKDGMTMTLASTAALGGAPLVGIEERGLNRTVYVRLTHAPTDFPIDLTPIVGQWAKIDGEALAERFGVATSTTDAVKPSLDAAQKAKTAAAFLELKPLRVIEVLKEQQIDGVTAHHFRISADKEAIKAFVLRLRDIRDDKASLAYEKFNDDLERAWPGIRIETFEAWVGKRDGLPKRLLLQAKTAESKEMPIAGATTIEMDFTRFDAPVKIDAPSDAKPLEEIMDMLLSSNGSKP